MHIDAFIWASVASVSIAIGHASQSGVHRFVCAVQIKYMFHGMCSLFVKETTKFAAV